MTPRLVACVAALAVSLLAGPAPASAHERSAPAPAPAGWARPSQVAGETPVPEADDLAELNWAGFGIRFGVLSLDVAAKDVPFFNDRVAEALDAYNRATGGKTGEGAMDLDARLIQVVPTLHLGGDGMFFRLDVPIGFGDDITTLGVGLYPLAYGYFIENLGLFPYAAAGIGAHYATSGRVSARGAKFDVSQSGAILQTRLAVGAKLRTVGRLNGVLELGYSPWTVAGLVDTGRLQAIKDAESLGAVPPDPASAVRAGVGPALDFSVGVEWL